MDVGVSSMQLDQAERGFSFRLDGPLDMRMGHDGPTAADVVAKASEADLANIIYIFGEERHSRAVARAIVAARKEAPITTTRALAEIVAKVVWAKPGEIHPATRTFQALRIFVNEELDELHLALSRRRARAETGRPAGGGVVPFAGRPHRQEFLRRARQDRRRLAASARGRRRSTPSFRILTKRPVTAGDDEVRANPRARSAKLRAAERTDAPRIRRRRVAEMAVARRRHEGRLTMRIIHLLVIGMLVFAAAYVYRIKMESTVAHRARAAAAMPKCASSATPSRHCAPNGPSSTRRCGCRASPSGI